MNLQAIRKGAPRPRPLRQSGFTLIEVMVVVIIIAFLAAIAYPSYTAHIARGKRADARGQLMQAAQFMQRFYAANDQYEKDRSGNDVATKIPDSIKYSPTDGTALYELAVEPTVTSYTLTMAPIAGRSMASDPCGSFTITSTGVRGVTGTKTRDECWK